MLHMGPPRMSAPSPATPVASRPLPPLNYPDALPVSARRQEIAAAIARHQVVVVCGETGSGKTTQLPKICLELGRGGKGGIIGHTQPRRLAATSVARRIAQEMQTELGDWVGYQIRFQERASASTAIKLMTDGILLAQTQRDPLLRRYDTLIVDEAHERSLNIDFLLGFLRQLLPRRPDLKLIITSASMDAVKLAAHFRSAQGGQVPIIEVSGRLFPIEVRWRPVLQDSVGEKTETSRQSDSVQERDLMDAVVDAVQECVQHGAGDVLVFLPGEREIREAAQALSEHALFGKNPGGQILPLFARLTQVEQERIFRPQGQARRIVLATNVAETSLTVPGIRYVVDSGLARIKRYGWRQKVEQLNVEPISQASAKQRAGRCGRLGPGLCIRLFDEADYARRPVYTDPEILRASLAAVILRMKALGLDDVEVFPFVDAPSGRAIADGYQQLQELGALDDNNRLSKIGRMLARLPIDPRLARMVLAAREQHCLAEMLTIVSALSVQDPRQQPLDAREAAEQAHRRFFNMADAGADGKSSSKAGKDKGQSEFLTWVHLWRWLNARCGDLSQRKQAALLKQHYLSPSRVREWRDVYQQLLGIVQEHRWQLNAAPATFEQIHRALLAGLLGNVGLRNEQQGREQGGGWLGTRDIRFHIHPASFLARRAGRWVLAGELVQTSRLYARCIANIEPQWIEQIGAGLLKKSWSDPRWQRKAGQVVAHERATLYGLTVYQGRRVHYGKIEPKEAREIFIRDALVAGDIATQLDFVAHNLKLAAQIEKLEHQTRRPDILVDDSLIMAFYDQHLPPEVCQTATLEKWAAGLDETQRKALYLSRDALMRHEASGVTTDVFPRTLRRQGVELALDYHFEPGSVKDGVTATVPLYALNALHTWPFEWLVPGMLKEKVQALLKSLPQKLRRHCVPLPDYAAGFHARWFAQWVDSAGNPAVPLLDALAQDMWTQVKVRPSAADFKLETLPAHLFMNFKVVDEHGRMLSSGRNLDALKAEHAPAAQASFQQMAARDGQVSQVLTQEPITAWSFGELPELMEITHADGQAVIGYPALMDKGTHCELDVFDDPELARLHHRRGLLRLFRLGLAEQVKYLNKNLPELARMGMLCMNLCTQEALRDQIVDVALEQACLMPPWPQNVQAFAERCQQGRTRLGLLAQEVARLTLQILLAWQAAQKKLVQAKAFEFSYKDMQAQLSALMGAQAGTQAGSPFLTQTPYAQLMHFPRYLQALALRIDKLRTDPARDARSMAEMAPLLAQYHRARAALKGGRNEGLDTFRWLLEELRVALFAQPLRTPMPVSVKRLKKAWEALQR